METEIYKSIIVKTRNDKEDCFMTEEMPTILCPFLMQLCQNTN